MGLRPGRRNPSRRHPSPLASAPCKAGAALTRPVAFSRAAERQLDDLYTHIAERSGAERAGHYVEQIVAFCRTLGDFPIRGRDLSYVLEGLRSVGFQRRVAITFLVGPRSVTVQGIFYGGQDWQARLP